MPFELIIVTPQGEVYRGAADRVVLPGAEGQFGVLPGHERFLSALRIGEVEMHTPDGKTVYGAMADGFAEVDGDQVVVLVESCEAADAIDVARAEVARDRAREGLEQLGRDENSERMAQFEAALLRASNRLEVSRRHGGAGS